MLAYTTVHTTGINWDSIGAIGGVVIAAMGFIYALMERRSRTIKNDITSAVGNLETVLVAKLETKDAVTDLKINMEKQLAEVKADLRVMQAKADINGQSQIQHASSQE